MFKNLGVTLCATAFFWCCHNFNGCLFLSWLNSCRCASHVNTRKKRRKKIVAFEKQREKNSEFIRTTSLVLATSANSHNTFRIAAQTEATIWFSHWFVQLLQIVTKANRSKQIDLFSFDFILYLFCYFDLYNTRRCRPICVVWERITFVTTNIESAVDFCIPIL